MKLLVVGASGFVGRHTLSYARSLGCEVAGTQSRAARPDLISCDLRRHRIADCVEASFLGGDEPVFGVICATFGQMDRCFLHRQAAHEVNVEQTVRLIKDFQALGVKPVFLSSSFVFDGETGSYDEESPRSPISEYGRHKVEVERFIEDHAPGALVLRLDKVVGDDPLEFHLFSEWYRWIKEGRPITCIRDQFFAPTFVGDVAEAIVVGCRKGLAGFYHVASSQFFKRDDLAREFVAALGQKARILSKPQEEFGFLDRRPMKSYLNSNKFVAATAMRFTSMPEVFDSFLKKAQREAAHVVG